jgi:hypothetical protein
VLGEPGLAGSGHGEGGPCHPPVAIEESDRRREHARRQPSFTRRVEDRAGVTASKTDGELVDRQERYLGRLRR